MSEKDIVIRMRQLWCCKGAEFARPELQAGWEEIERLRERVAYLEAALKEITRGKGAFDRDPLEHAYNAIADMKIIAKRALTGTWEGGEDD